MDTDHGKPSSSPRGVEHYLASCGPLGQHPLGGDRRSLGAAGTGRLVDRCEAFWMETYRRAEWVEATRSFGRDLRAEGVDRRGTPVSESAFAQRRRGHGAGTPPERRSECVGHQSGSPRRLLTYLSFFCHYSRAVPLFAASLLRMSGKPPLGRTGSGRPPSGSFPSSDLLPCQLLHSHSGIPTLRPRRLGMDIPGDGRRQRSRRIGNGRTFCGAQRAHRIAGTRTWVRAVHLAPRTVGTHIGACEFHRV